MDELLFILTEDHIKLLRNANVSWCRDMCGAPAIDAKFPYGDSDLVASMAEILDIALDSEDDSAEADLVRERRRVRRHNAVMLGVILSAGVRLERS